MTSAEYRKAIQDMFAYNGAKYSSAPVVASELAHPTLLAQAQALSAAADRLCDERNQESARATFDRNIVKV